MHLLMFKQKFILKFRGGAFAALSHVNLSLPGQNKFPSSDFTIPVGSFSVDSVSRALTAQAQSLPGCVKGTHCSLPPHTQLQELSF